MDKLGPLFRAIQKNIDRVAIVVFVVLTGLVIFVWQRELAQPPPQPEDIPPTEMTAHLPDEAYTKLMSALSWGGAIFEKRPLNDEHPFIDILRYNIFAEREPPTEQEIIQEVNRLLQDGESALAEARELGDTAPRKRELLERCIRNCEQVITVWNAYSGAQQARAQELRGEAQTLLDEIIGEEEDAEEV